MTKTSYEGYLAAKKEKNKMYFVVDIKDDKIIGIGDEGQAPDYRGSANYFNRPVYFISGHFDGAITYPNVPYTIADKRKLLSERWFEFIDATKALLKEIFRPSPYRDRKRWC